MLINAPTIDVRREPIDSVEFRRVLGHYPSGVVAITGIGSDGGPVGMVATSFTSVSLDPPLVAFFPMKTSATFTAIERQGEFCVNVLASSQEDVCRKLAAKGGDKFADVGWHPNGSGVPIIDDAVAWIDCEVSSINDAGDHWIVVGLVRDLRVEQAAVPMLFFQGGYGRFTPLSVSAVSAPDVVDHLRLADQLRPGMIAGSRELGVEILLTALIGDGVVALATSGHPDPERLPTRVGQRMPYLAPLGVVFAAWSDHRAWLERARLAPEERSRVERLVDLVRRRGWSATLGTASYRDLERALARLDVAAPSEEERRAVEEAIDPLTTERQLDRIDPAASYAVRTVAVPVLDTAGQARLALTAYGLPRTSTGHEIELYLDVLQRLAGSLGVPATDGGHDSH